MYDEYQPTEAFACPICGATLDGWQGKAGPNLLLIWRQGERHPVDHLHGDDWPKADLVSSGWTLPASFEIYAYDDADHCVTARCSAPSGTWNETILVEALEWSADGRRSIWRRPN